MRKQLQSLERTKICICFLLFIASTATTSANAHKITIDSGLDTEQDGKDRILQVEEEDVNRNNVNILADNSTSNSFRNEEVYIAGIFDTSSFEWGEELFGLTIRMINDHTDGWFDNILDDGTVLKWSVSNSACDSTKAATAYWDSRTQNGNQPMHGVIGCRCSSASQLVASIAGLESVPQISFASTSPRLSDNERYPFFSRTVGPANSFGNVGALVSLLRKFDWSRVSILQSDTPYSNDISTAFKNLWVGEHDADITSTSWTGEVAYSYTITLDSNQNIDLDSTSQALNGVPTDDPTINSRVIILFAHNEHAYQILETAKDMKFQEDTIWIGVGDWINRYPSDTSWIPPMPGYLGVAPYRNRDQNYYLFMRHLRDLQMASGMEPWDDLPDYAAEHMVDAIVTLAQALSLTLPQKRRNGSTVVSILRTLNFAGISGQLSFTDKGDRNDPRYSVFNMQQDEMTGKVSWKNVGEVKTFIGSANIDPTKICFAKFGCNRTIAPSDTYPIPKIKLPKWVPAVVAIIVILLIVTTIMYVIARYKKNMYKNEKDKLKERIDSDIDNVQKQMEDAKKREEMLIKQRFDLQEKPETWTTTDDTLVEVTPYDDEYWTVVDRLKETMDDVHISKLWRIQNDSLWSYYSFHKERLALNGTSENEQWVFHGTRSLDPAVVYNDRHDGFMMQFASAGYWGRGIYFALNAIYSHAYAYKPPPKQESWLTPWTIDDGEERPGAMDDEREMFLAKLLAGDDIYMDRNQNKQMEIDCRNLIAPPINPNKSNNQRYSSVSGSTGGSHVWIVYENGRAYPDYLIRYYRGDQDYKRTPYNSKDEVMNSSSSLTNSSVQGIVTNQTYHNDDNRSKQSNTTNSTNSSIPSNDSSKVVWEFLDNTGWKPYSNQHQLKIEKKYQKFSRTNSNDSNNTNIKIKTKDWMYEVDVKNMVQRNLQHCNRKERIVRRRIL